MLGDLARVLYHESTILSRLDELADQITRDFRKKELTVVAVLNGSFMFMGDLLRRIPLPLRVDCISVASYHGGTESTGRVTFDQLTPPDVRGRHVLILDDILDSGGTLKLVTGMLRQLEPASVKTCVLLRKDRPVAREVPVDYCGFEIPDEFVVGYGLDYNNYYRNLPDIVTLNPSAIARYRES